MRKLLCALALAAAVSGPVRAQTLSDAFEAAWQRSAAGAAQAARAEEGAARRDTAGDWLRESPSIAAGYRSDRIDKNQGGREIEVELGVRLALPGERRANLRVGAAEAAALDARRAAARLKLAHEVREAYWAAHLTRVERELAQRRLDEAARLATDLARRLKVGEAPRVDANQARGTQLAAEAVLRAAQLDEQRALRAFTQLTGLPQLAGDSEAPAFTPTPAGAAPTDRHPLLEEARAAAAAARARADQAGAVRRDTPEFTLALTRDRSAFAEVFGNTVRVGVKVPLGTEVRNRVRIAQTGAERVEAEVALQLETERIQAQWTSARDELAAAREAQAAAAERARLAIDTQQLISRAFTLGERDLAARLRADTERFEAELAAARAQTELGRAISRLNQSLGRLP